MPQSKEGKPRVTNRTQGERLARIETLLEDLPIIKEEIKQIREEQAAHSADLERFKSKGTGILIGVGLAAGGTGAASLKLWQSIFQ